MKNIAGKSFDWVYVDTRHDYVTTREKLHLAERLVKPEAFISGHDFSVGNPYVALPYGVIPAVYEFCLERDWTLAHLTLAPNGQFSLCLRRAEPAAGEAQR